MMGCCVGCDALCVHLPWDSTQRCGESPPSTAALLHLSHGSALEWEKECELEELRPPLGAEVVLREGLKRSLCEEAVQMYFPSCINQLEGSKGS